MELYLQKKMLMKNSCLERNLFQLPKGSASKSYINEMMRLLTGWINENAIKDIAFKGHQSH